MASASNNPSFIIPNITSLVSVKFEGPNYLNWTTQFILVLRSHDLLSIVDGSEVCPAQYLIDSDGKVTSDINPAYLVWQKKDQFILTWLNVPLVRRFCPPFMASLLPNKFGIHCQQDLLLSLAPEFLTSKDNSKLFNKSVENDDLISYVVGGLNPMFTPFITTLNFATRDHSISFDDFQTELLNFEQLLEAQNKNLPSEANSLPVKYVVNSITRHLTVTTEWTSTTKACIPPAQLAAMVAHTHIVQEPEQPWYLDSGANNHITSELENLTLNQQPYHGNDTVTVGNGGGLTITTTGSSFLSNSNTRFFLSDILHCPNASSNLLSIQKFCHDNNCYFILTSTHFLVKDM
ncbi:hypothetical protein Pint_06093 [Pistacia integerrima]|uniref:Uncharacterized protein n=1 Tax=Pistacia integerrima TaxID=434235 RepID=A0ACC0Z6D0_9ROSI|nr:hypothetical protein Pint_06093 [Pistacia integerrima]